MAKMKLWVRNLIIVIATVVCLAGVGVGMFFLLKPTKDDNKGRELSQQQKDYILNMQNTSGATADISDYDDLVLEDGQSVEVSNIIASSGDYLLIRNSITGKPEFFKVQKQDSQGSQSKNVQLAFVDIEVDYTHVFLFDDQYAMFGDWAVVYSVVDTNKVLSVVSLKTGEVVLNNDQVNKTYLTSTGNDLSTYVGSYQISISDMFAGCLITEKLELVGQDEQYSSTKTIYFLENPETKIVFDSEMGNLIDYEVYGDKLLIITSKWTKIYSLNLSAEGEVVELLSKENTFVDATEEDYQLISGGQYYKDVVVHTVQFLNNNLIIIEKNTALEDKEYQDADYNVLYNIKKCSLDYYLAGITYTFYDLNVNQIITDAPEIYSYLEVLDSFVDGYFVINNVAGGEDSNPYSRNATANIYDSQFDYVLSYNADKYGTIVAYDGSHFVTSGKSQSTILSPWGDDASHYAGYSIVSQNIYNNYVVVKNDIYYSIYNTSTGTLYSDKILFASEIMDGKIIIYAQDKGYYLVDCDAEMAEKIYNFDTTTYGLNLAMGSVGYYFTCQNGTYTFVGLNGVTYQNVQSYSFSIVNNQVYLSMTFKNGDRKLIISNILGELGTLTEEEISETYSCNFVQPSSQKLSSKTEETSLLAANTDSNFSIKEESGGSGSTQSDISAWIGNAAEKEDSNINTTVTISKDTAIPTYNIQMSSDMFWDLGAGDINTLGFASTIDKNEVYGISSYRGRAQLTYRSGYGYSIGGSENLYYDFRDYFLTECEGCGCPINWYIANTTYVQDNFYLISVALSVTPYSFSIMARYAQSPVMSSSNIMDYVYVGLRKDSSLFISNVSISGESYDVFDGYGYRSLSLTSMNWNRRFSDIYYSAFGSNLNFLSSTSFDLNALTYNGSSCPAENIGGETKGDYIVCGYTYFCEYEESCARLYDINNPNKLFVEFQITPYKSEFKNFLGNFLNLEDKYSKGYNGTNGYATVTIGKSESSTETDSDYANSFKIELGLAIENTYTLKECSYTYVDNKKDSHSSTKYEITSSDLYFEVDWIVFIYKYYRRIKSISDLYVTFSANTNFINLSTQTIYVANQNSASPSAKAKLAALAVTEEDKINEGGNGSGDYAYLKAVIEYGFIESRDEQDFYNKYYVSESGISEREVKNGVPTSGEVYYIGSPRPNLSYFTYNCTFGYKLNGLKFEYANGSYTSLLVNENGIYTTTTTSVSINGSEKKLSPFEYLCYKDGFSLKPDQTALTFDIQYNYLNSGDDGKTASVKNLVNGSVSSGTNGAYSFNATLSTSGDYLLPTFKDYDSYATSDAANNVLQSPKGWTFVGWAVGYGSNSASAIKYDYSKSNHYQMLTSPQQSADNMKLAGGTDFASAAKTYEMLENNKVGYNILKYLPYVEDMDMTINSNATTYCTDLRTLNLTAVYAPKEYTFRINVTGDTNWKSGSILYVFEDGEYVQMDNGIWSTTVYYNETLEIPKMYVQVGSGENAYFYDVVLYDADTTIMQTLDGSQVVSYDVHVNTADLTNVLQDGKNFYQNCKNGTEVGEATVDFRAGLRAIEYETAIDGSQDSHVYGDGANDFLHEDKKLITSITISGNVNNGDNNAGTKYYGTISSEGEVYGYNDSKLVFTTPFNFISGQVYTLKISGISYNYKVKVEFSSGDSSSKSSHTYFWNWAGEENTNASFGDAILSINLNPVSGGTYAGVGTNNNKVTLTITIETAFIEGTITVEENGKNDAKSTDVGDISVSDKVNEGYHEENDLQNGTTYYIGGGSTILLSLGETMYEKIHGTNMNVVNNYLSGLKITKKTFENGENDTSIFEWGNDSLFINLTNKLMSGTSSGCFKGGTYSEIKYSETSTTISIINAKNTKTFLQQLYADISLDDNWESGSATYVCEEIEGKAYLIIVYHTNYGIRSGILYNVGDHETGTGSDDKIQNAQYTFALTYGKYNSTLTFDSTLNGEIQKGEIRFLTNNDQSGKGDKIVKTDDNKKTYIQIFGRKVYVQVVENKLQVVDSAGIALTNDYDKNSLSGDYAYLFGTDGILKNNIDESGYLFVYVNKSSYEYLKDAEGNIITEKQYGQSSITKDDKTYVWNGTYYVCTASNLDTGIYWNSAESWFRKFKDNESENDVNIEANDSNNQFNFASIKPSNRFTFDIIAKKGQIAKTITIYYNSTTKYIISLSGININNGETTLTPAYIITKYEYSDGGWGTGSALSLSKTNNVIEIEHMLLYIITSGSKNDMGFALNSIDFSADSTLLCSIDIACISASAHISVDFVDYSMVVVGGNDVGNFGYSLDADNNNNINIVNESGNAITIIEFNQSLTLDENLFVSRKNNQTNIEQNSCASEKIYFMVLGGANGAKVHSTFTESAIYTVSINGTNAENNTPANPSKTYDNTAQWGDFDDEKVTTQITIGNASYANWIASFTIGTKSISSSITSDIEFGNVDGSESNVLEETLKTNSNLTDVKTLDSDDLLYETGNGQVASGGTSFKLSMENFGTLTKNDYGNVKSTYYYATKVNLFGNKIVYTIATQYGYDWTGATLVIDGISAEINSDKTTGDILRDERTIATYSLVGNVLTVEFKVASIDNVNLDLHYDAKEFVVTYNTSSDFGTSPVGLNNYSETDTTNQTRTFTYNLKQDLNKGWGDELVYNRIGYDQLGWAYGNFYKNSSGKTNNTTSSTLSTKNYALQLYSITGGIGVTDVDYDNAKNWYISLGKDYANVFGTDNNGKITIFTIWNAKTYSLVLDYNDNGSEDNGSTTSTKYTASWVFDMPISSADIAGDNVSFANANFTTQNTLINAISRVYRLGYTFNGWYYTNGTFNGTGGWTLADTSYANGTAAYNGLVYLAHNDNVLTINDKTAENYSFKLALTSTSGKLGYPESQTTPSQVFGYSVYQAINGAGSWAEEVGETASSIKLYASWTANTYGFIYDLNGDNSVSGYADNGYKSLNYNNGTISANIEAGVGSSFATLAFGDSGVAYVQFDTNINEVLSAYAYRKGYKFTGWYFARTGETLAEETLLNQELLLQLLNGADELVQVKNKIAKNYDTVDLVETLGTTGIINDKDSNKNADGNKDLSSLSDNAILLHAQWEELPYLVNIDLNNWKISDYNKVDGEYMAGNSQYTGQNNTTNVQLEIYFDTQFKDLRLKIDGIWIEKTGGTTSITRNGKTYTISGDTAYKVLVQILTAYGYTLGDGEYDFAIYGSGDGTTSTVNINKETMFGVNLYDKLIYFADTKAATDDKIDNSNSTGGINGDGTLSTSGAKLGTIDYSGTDKGDWHDYTSDDMKNSAKVGYRQFTLFAIWTIKNIYLDNVGTKEEYSNALDENNTNQTLFIKDNSGSGNKQFYDGKSYFKGTSDTNFALGNIDSNATYYSTNTYYLSPSTGQYFSSLTIWFNDNYHINSKYSNQTRGKLTLTFEWDKVNRKLTITSATLEIGGMSSGEFVATYTATNDGTSILVKTVNDKGEMITTTITNVESCETPIPIVTENGQIMTISGETSYCFVGGIEISVSKYMLAQDVSDKNINTAYKTSEWIDSNIPTWLTNAGLKDVHYLTINVTGQKSNLVFDGTTMGQTFDVDYYRFVRPSDGMQTYIDNNEDSSTYGQEVWDSEFMNDWSMFEVYKTITYRYGEYASTAYSYATNFAFSSWYFYQGHITNYENYANYGGADIIYQTHESYLIPQVQFVWNEAESKYVFTQTLSYYLKDSDGNVISSKQDGQDVITGWLLVNSDGSYQCIQGQYALYDFIGTWSEPTTYYWCTWTGDNGEEIGGYVTGVSGSENSATNLSIAPESDKILDSGELYKYITDENGNKVKQQLYKITIHSYSYNDDYKSYRYDNKAINGNVSIVAVYVPAQTRKVNYYTWKDSGKATGYVELPEVSNEYVLGEKRVATVTGAKTGTESRSYSYIQYWELGTNNKYYRVGFSGFNNFDENGNPTINSALEFLMQFVNKNNYSTYKLGSYNNISITYQDLVEIINNLGYGTMGEADNDVITLAVNLYKTLLKQTDSYKAYEYLQNSDVVLNLGLEITQDDITINYNKLKALALLSGITTFAEDDFNNSATILTLYEKVLKTTLNEEDIKNLLNKDSNAIDDIMNSLAGDIIDKLTAEQLAVVLDKISMDYFGYVLIYPSENIGYWPSGTYLAGWYMVPDSLRQELIKSDNNAVLTFDSDNFIEGTGENAIKCYNIISETTDPNGNTTYIIEFGDKKYEVTKFNVFNKEQLDILSRVETSVHIFAAYNTIKFEMIDAEYLNDEDGKPVTAQQKDTSGNLLDKITQNVTLEDGTETSRTYVWDGSHYVFIISTSGNVDQLDINIKDAHETVVDISGNPYLYQKTDVYYVVLNNTQMLKVAKEFAKNNNIPTSLQTTIGTTIEVYDTLAKAKTAAQSDDTIVAFIYNAKGYEKNNNELVMKFFNTIYKHSTNCYVNGELFELVDRLRSIYNDNLLYGDDGKLITTQQRDKSGKLLNEITKQITLEDETEISITYVWDGSYYVTKTT